MNHLRTTLFLLIITTILLSSETRCQVYQQTVFSNEIKSVKIFSYRNVLDFPIIPMNGFVTIQFDDIGEYERDLKYSLTHCDRDWQKSELNTSEYLDGFDDADIDDFVVSRNTYIDYLHHEFILPNVDMRWKVSGNYIVKIWDAENDDELLMQLRFVVFETAVSLRLGQIFRSIRAGRFDSHQEISFSAGIKGLNLDDPMRSISATVIQNHNWSSANDSIRPRRLMLDELFFDQHNQVVFPAMPEYRLADIRSLNAGGFGVHEINAYSDGINATMVTDEPRGYKVHFDDDRDLNGAFAIESNERQGSAWNSEYMHTLFTLHYFNVPEDSEIYLMGQFNDFRVDSSSRMSFDEKNSIFYKEIILKQGVYDYAYAVKQPNKPLSYEITEGYDNRAQNDYHVLLYYRPFIGKYDRVICYGRLE